jgi:hypothetical protein
VESYRDIGWLNVCAREEEEMARDVPLPGGGGDVMSRSMWMYRVFLVVLFVVAVVVMLGANLLEPVGEFGGGGSTLPGLLEVKP